MATTSPGGQLALAFESPSDTELELYTPEGERETSAPIAGVRGGSTDMESWFHWSDDGWHGIAGGAQRHPFAAWDENGALEKTLDGYDAVHAAPDGEGGSIVLATEAADGVKAHLLWVNAGGEVTRDVLLDRAGTQAIVHLETGHVLVLASGGDQNASARWFDDEGAPLTDWFDAKLRYEGAASPALRLLLDGRPVVFDGTRWAAAFRDGEATVEGPPAWLAGLGGKRLGTLPDGKGYLALDGEAGRGPGSAELLTPEGESCGPLAPPPAAPPAGGSRSVFGYWLGPDGTLVEGSTLSGPSLTGGGSHCAFRWWPELFSP